MGSKKRSAWQKQKAEFAASLGGMDDLFASENARSQRHDEERAAARRHKACERKNRYASRYEAELTAADTPSTDGSATPSLPNDTTFDKDEIESVLPDDVKDEVVKDFIESGDAQDKTEITEEMIENPVSKSDADYVKNVYETGLKEGEKLAQTGDLVPLAIIASIALGAAAAGAIAFIMNRRAKR